MATFEQFNRPKTRAEFERSLFIVSEQLRNGKLHFAPHVTSVVDGLRRVRILPNGRVDFASVDEAARLTANQMSHMAERVSMMPRPSLDDRSGNVDETIESPVTAAKPKKESPKKESPKKESPKKESPKKESPKKESPKKKSPKKKSPKKKSPKKKSPKKKSPKKKSPKKKL